ncbi:hypothetical protein, partial [Rheinheimera sp.]|uniref:hypothetical protein n=1 Tax=Rheinheimera sp. TaxID=1869214 RepID=UPI003AF9579B
DVGNDREITDMVHLVFWETPTLPSEPGWRGSGKKGGAHNLRQSAILPDFQGLPACECCQAAPEATRQDGG